MSALNPSLGFLVVLNEPEDIAFGVLAIGEPADAWNGLARHQAGAAVLNDLRNHGIEILHVDRADETSHRLAIVGVQALVQAAIDAGLILRTGVDEPIVHVTKLIEPPAKQAFVEGTRARGIVGVNLEM